MWSPNQREDTVCMSYELIKLVVTRIKSLARGEKGATAIEYGLVAALIAVVIIAAVRLSGTRLQSTFNKVASGLS